MSLTIQDILLCPNMPSLPAVAMEVLEHARDKNVKFAVIATSINNDPALAAKILKTVNSSYYGLAKPCPTIERAMALLGLNTVKSLTLGFSLVELTRHGPDDFDYERFWRNSIFGAAASRRLADAVIELDPDEAFAASLVLDIGMLALQTADEHNYGRYVARSKGNDKRLTSIENDMYGFDHCEVGAAFANKWSLPPEFIDALTFHHNGGEYEGVNQEFVRLIALSTQLIAAINAPKPEEALDAVYEQAAEWFDLTRGTMLELLSHITDDAHQLARLFDVKMEASASIAQLLAEADELETEHRIEQAKHIDSLERKNETLSDTVEFLPADNVGSRKSFDESIDSHFKDATENGGSLAVVLVEVDDLNQVRSEYGPTAVYAVHDAVIDAMNEGVRETDEVCRFDDSGYAVILPGGAVRTATDIAERLRAGIERKAVYIDNAQPIGVTASLGIATYLPGEGTFKSAATLVRAAVRALQAAQHAGRNCVRLCRIKPAA